MGRPPSDLDDYLEWQQRLENQKESGLSIEVFCLQERVSKSTFFRWARQLADGIPESMLQEKANRERAETGEAVFLPITLAGRRISMRGSWDVVLKRASADVPIPGAMTPPR